MEKKREGVSIVRESGVPVLYVQTGGVDAPSLELDGGVMAGVVDVLREHPDVQRVVFLHQRNYVYDEKQTGLLRELAQLYGYLAEQQEILQLRNLVFPAGYEQLREFWRLQLRGFLGRVKSDPIGCYVEIQRAMRKEKIKIKHAGGEELRLRAEYVEILGYLLQVLGQLDLIQRVKEHTSGYRVGSREIYSRIFQPLITPEFLFSRLQLHVPVEAEQVDRYQLEDGEVTLFRLPGRAGLLYHLVPKEFLLDDEKYQLLNLCRETLAKHRPSNQEFLQPEKMRETFFHIGQGLLRELAGARGVVLSYRELRVLAEILVRYTVGFGLLEVLLADKKIQDVVVNGPLGESCVFVVHQEYDECMTNILPAAEEGESWATKFRIMSGRPLDEANPVLDTELLLQRARARVSVMQRPLSPAGLAFAFRRHRDEPWTFPLFMQNKMMTGLAAGLLSFVIGGGRSLLFAGTRGSGKTSILGATMVEILKKHRMIVLEDSVTDDSEVLVQRNGIFERKTIGELVDTLIEKYGCWYNLTGHEILGNPEGVSVLAMDKAGRIRLDKVSQFIRHRVTKPVYRIRTRTGREVKVTGDHSLFGLNDAADISEIKVRELQKGNFIAVPRKIPAPDCPFVSLNLIHFLPALQSGFFSGIGIQKFLQCHRREVFALGKERGYSHHTIKGWMRTPGSVPVTIVHDLVRLGLPLAPTENICYHVRGSRYKLPLSFLLDADFLTLMGLWIADGCYDKHSTLFSVIEPELRGFVYRIAQRYQLRVKVHSDGVTLVVHSLAFKQVMREVFSLTGDAYTKRIPSWMFNLSNEQISCVLKGIFSGDGSCSDKDISLALASSHLLRDVQTLLLRFGISFCIGRIRNDKTYSASVSNLKSWILFRQHLGFLQKHKTEKLNFLCTKVSTHDSSDIVPFSLSTKKEMKVTLPIFSSGDYIVRDNHVGREKLSSLLQHCPLENPLISKLHSLASSDILWDEVLSVEVLEDYEGYVYDISVPECESFVCNNIIAHNTQELPLGALRGLGYNVQGMKVRGALMHGGVELAADEGIRTSLRFGDSCLIVGEIRSTEARALFEAMRVGALANVVAGTIHGGDAYSVFDRVVNDLDVPRTSFKATDLIVVANPVRSADGLSRKRRIIAITEVRKGWEEDPVRERGFVDLMRYDSKRDELMPTAELVQGESEVLKQIAGSVKEWAGDWDAVWQNIQLRARVRELLLQRAEQYRLPGMLEAGFVVASNDMFHLLSEQSREKRGVIDAGWVLRELDEWMGKQVRRKVA